MIRLLFLVFLLPLHAQQVPKLDKVFPETTLLTKTARDGKTTHFFATDATFLDLKKKLLETLGKGWLEAKAKTIKGEKETEENTKARRAVGQSAKFTHPDAPNFELSVVMFNNPAMGKARTMLVTQIKKK